METQVLQLLQATTVPDTNTIRRAEQSLADLHRQHEYPSALLNITTHSEIDAGSRKAALTALRKYINSTWSPTFEEASSEQVSLPEDTRKQIRSQTLAICTSPDSSNDINQNLAGKCALGNESVGIPHDEVLVWLSKLTTSIASVVSKIASADFPDQWPELFPQLISVLKTSPSDAAVQGSLRVLYELVDSGLSDEQFFQVARELVAALQHVTINTNHNTVVQAMALKVLGACFDNLEQVLATEFAPAVKAFLNETMPSWMSFFINTLKLPLPEVSGADFENANNVIHKWKGVVALKIQVLQVSQSHQAYEDVGETYKGE